MADKRIRTFPFFIIAAALFLAPLRFSIGYYYMLRLGVIACAVYGFLTFTKLHFRGIRWLFIPAALPFGAMTMKRDEWAPIDLIIAMFFALAGVVICIKQRILKRKWQRADSSEKK